MPKRIVSFLLALYYLSVSLAVFDGHFHDHGDQLHHPCAACAWHSESVSDGPIGPAFAIVPDIVVAHVAEIDWQLCAVDPSISADRGPPLFS